MELLLLPVIVMIMLATCRSPGVGLAAAGVLGVFLARGGEPASIAAGTAVAATGVLLGYGARSRVPGARTVLIAGTPLTAALSASALVWEREPLRQRLAETLGAQAGDAVPAAVRAELVEVVIGLAPAIAAISAYALTLGAYGAARWLLPRLQAEVPPLGALSRFRLPFFLVWSFAVALAAVLAGRGLPVRWLLFLGLNFCLVHAVAFFIQGIAVGHHLLAARAVPVGMQVLMGLLVLLMPMPFVVGGVGLLDLWFDFRVRGAPPPEAA